MITSTTWLSTDLSTTVQAPAFCPMSYHTTPCLSLIIPLALRRAGFFLNDFLNDHPSFLVLRTAFLRGMPGAGKKSAHLPELCPLQREASLAPKGATSLPVRCRWHYEGPSYLPTSLPQPLFCLQLQDRCVNTPHFRLGKGEMRLSSPEGFWGTGAVFEGKTLAPKLCHVKSFSTKHSGWCPQSPITPHPEQTPMGTLTKGAHYFACCCRKVLLSAAADRRKAPTIRT